MFPCIRKAFTCLMVVLLLLIFAGGAFGWDYYPTSYHWGFENYSYLGFSQPVNFTASPRLGVPYDSSLVGYWNMNEASGSVARDSSGKGNNGTIYGATRVNGKYENALNFDGRDDYVALPNLNFDTGDFSLEFWFYIDALTSAWNCLINKGAYGYVGYGVSFSDDNKLSADIQAENGSNQHARSAENVSLGWNHGAIVFDRDDKIYVYLNNLVTEIAYESGNNNSLSNGYVAKLGAFCNTDIFYFTGILDEVRIFDRPLSAAEVTALYAMNPHAQPDPISFANYYNFTDPITNNTMLVYIDNPNANSNNVIEVTCTNFFAGNRLAFRANNSATVNVWTNLGQPVFTTGVWNSQNYTSTLTLDASSTAKLEWIFTYTIMASADAHSAITPGYVSVSGGGNQLFSINAGSGYYVSHVYVDGNDQGSITSYNFTNVQGNHTISVTSEAVAPTNTPTPPFPIDTELITVAVFIIIVVFILAFKKGYITIKIKEETETAVCI